MRYDERWEWAGFVLVVGVLLFLALNMAQTQENPPRSIKSTTGWIHRQ